MLYCKKIKIVKDVFCLKNGFKNYNFQYNKLLTDFNEENILKKIGFNWTYLIVGLLIIAVFYLVFVPAGTSGQQITYSSAIEKINNDEISDFYAKDGIAKLRKADGSAVTEAEFPSKADYYFKFNPYSREFELVIEAINEKNIDEDETNNINSESLPTEPSILEQLAPFLYIGIGLLVVYLVFKMISSTNKGTLGFGKSKARTSVNVKVRFHDVAGADEEKEELREIVEFLRSPEKFTNLGARIPKGILLVGPPGTGKTLLARAVAGESNVPFLSISGSDFVEMFVGVGASRVRDLFEEAKKNMPCIVFIDEIDAVGRQRGAGLGGGNDEREQTLNQLLVEMDGFEANEGIIVLAATNRSDILDPALLRAGRFDRQIYVHIPDVRGREGIIKIHARNKPVDEEVNFQTLARITSGFTGADIENMLNEAAILAARAGRAKLIMEDLTEGINKVIMGPQKKSRVVTDSDKKITAYHESGHAILGKKLKYCEPIQEVSIIPRGNAGGYTMQRPENDDRHKTLNKLNDEIAMIMGGRVAEEIIFNDITTGASSDINKATEIARKMVTEWGMSKLGFIGFSVEDHLFIGRDYQSKVNYSEKMAAEIDNEIKAILDNNYKRAKEILTTNKDLLDKMSELLLKKETIYHDEVELLIQGKTAQEVAEIMEQKDREKGIRQETVKREMAEANILRELDAKVKTGEVFYKNGIISKDDLQKLVARREEQISKMKKMKESKNEQPNKETKEKLINEVKKEKKIIKKEQEVKEELKQEKKAEKKTEPLIKKAKKTMTRKKDKDTK